MLPREVELDRIVVATDLGPDADEAVRQAHAWASVYRAELIACVVLPTPFIRPESPLDGDQSWQAQALLRERLAAITERAPEESLVAVRRGAPFLEISRVAEELEAGLIVVGSPQKNGLRRSVVGGTAEKLVRSSQIPVLIARPSPATASILAATDLSDPCFPVIAAGADYAERRGGQLSVLHCIEHDIVPLHPGISSSSFSPSVATLRTRGKAALARALAGLEVDADGVVEDAPPRVAIVREAAERGCEMVVVGTSGRTGLMRLALGNLAESILRSAPCSTLVIRLGERRPDVFW
jgi:nucleotide-binding universal stress UspA family protein